MDDSNAFTKRHVEEVTAAKRTLLDELNLPPVAKNFIRDNARILQVSFVLIVGAICAWNYYNYYKATTNDKASQQLSQATLINDRVQRVAALEKIATDFPTTGSALWSQLTLASDYLAQKEYVQALAILQDLNEDVDQDNPLFPLVQQFTGIVYELSGEFDLALPYYEKLSSLPGFAALGYLESGRIYELKGMVQNAKDAYEKANAANDIKADQRAWVQEKINTL